MDEVIYLKEMMMNNREWKSFRIEEIFIVVDGFYNKKPPMTGGKLPFLGATEKNNGITGYTDVDTVYTWTKTGEATDETTENKLFGPNWIAVTNNGSVGHAYFMPYQYTSSHDVTSLYLPDRELTEHLALFLIKMLERAGEPFSYARKWRPVRLRKTPIYLPVKKDGTPDWTFMEEYVQIKSNQIKNTYQSPKQHEISDFRGLDEVEWREFFVTDIFHAPKRGKRIISSNYQFGSKPIISSAGGNNGVIAFIGNDDNVREYQNCLSVANGGVSAGFAYYHPYKFIATDHVTQFKGDNLNKYHYLFLSLVIKKQMQEKYHFSREMTDGRLKREKLLLPITSDGHVDFDFMEQYIKRLENNLIKQEIKQ